jgi:sugar/nucleoside kinase (ribokinase family)
VSARVLVIGDALLDVRVAPEDEVARGSDVPARISLSPGGQGANVAVRLARQGVRAELMAALGPDAAGSLVRGALAAEGVSLRELTAEATGCVVVLGEAGGERTMLSQRAPFAHLVAAEAAHPADAVSADWVVVSGYLLHETPALEIGTGLAGGPARRMLLGCAVPDTLVPAWRAAAIALRPDLLVVNRDESARLVPPELRGVAVTDATGASLSLGGVSVTSTSATTVAAIDTTGAGDAFAAVLLAGLFGSPWPPTREVMRDAVEEAVALAGRVAREQGAQARVAGEQTATLPE